MRAGRHSNNNIRITDQSPQVRQRHRIRRSARAMLGKRTEMKNRGPCASIFLYNSRQETPQTARFD